MVDDFDKELEQAPEGSIIGPIFIGCGAMGLGCVFSLAAITFGLIFFAPGIWDLIVSVGGNPMVEEAMPQVEANEDVVAALGMPIEVDLSEIEEAPDSQMGNVEFGDMVEMLYTYDLTGPNGTAQLEAVGSRRLVADDEWEIRSLTVILSDGTAINVFPGEGETLTPPPVPAVPDGGADEEAATVDESAVDEPAEDTVSEPTEEPESAPVGD